MNKQKFNNFLTNLSQKLQILDYGFIPISTIKEDNFLNNNLLKEFDNSTLPEYIINTIEQRFQPESLLNNTKTLFICAIPFNTLEKIVPKLFKEAPQNAPYYGLIANYATYLDYHYEAQKIMTKLIEEITQFIKSNFNYKIFVDTAPLAERFFASEAKIGFIGKNNCLKPYHANSSSFICGFVCDYDFKINNELLITPNNNPAQKVYCPANCQLCINRCPNHILNSNKPNFLNCISSLTMEQRHFLDKEQRAKLQYHIFGCSNCSTACFNANEADFKVDLNWLLAESAGKLKKIIKQTTLNYAGITLLRRNALAVLENFNNFEAKTLIERFSKQTQSELLQKTCIDILNKH
ncbi:QueG-associated DUF1730 domain-containing protein [Lentisphaerota bacterium WC36G]|nr:DUF1730 domain-containing protein [Lentisphaerae bacterium WC36]